jgi:lipopolysaccharide transport system ATP-binding protein
VTDDIAIEIEGLGKAYAEGGNPLKAFLTALRGNPGRKSFWALRDVTRHIPRRTSIGIIGRNGSGKSTLLQLICGTLTPSEGRIATHGKIAAMLELGAGFDPDFTGRENVFLTASVYGLSDEEIRRRFPAIEAFADIGAYIDRPVAEYSSGMYARLAFAVCAHVDADILVVDEILGVGDSGFQQKCQRFMRDFRERGTLVFVSHDANAVLSACEEAIWLNRGRVAAEGAADEVLSLYMDADAREDYDVSLADRALATPAPERRLPLDLRLGDRNRIAVSAFNTACARHGFGTAQISDCFFSDGSGSPLSEMHGGQVVTLHVRASVTRDLSSPIVGFMFRNSAGQNLFGDNTFLTYRKRATTVPAGADFEARLEFQMPYLVPGTYTLAPSIISGTQSAHVPVNWLEDAIILTVSGTTPAPRHGKVGVTMHHFAARRASAEAEDPRAQPLTAAGTA